VLVLGCRAGTVLNEESCKVHTFVVRHLVQRSPPAVVLGFRISAMLHKYPRQIYICPRWLQCPM